jgi:hypothetical protein
MFIAIIRKTARAVNRNIVHDDMRLIEIVRTAKIIKIEMISFLVIGIFMLFLG